MLGKGGGKVVEGGKGVTRTIKTMVIRAVGRSKTSGGKGRSNVVGTRKTEGP